MAIIKLIGFTGEVPKLSARLLPENAAQSAFNTRLTSGDLRPIRRSRFRYSFGTAPANGYGTIYKHGTEWLAWQGLVHAAPGPVAQDRLYYTGDGAPKMRVNGTVYNLAVPRPTAALTAAVSGTPTSPNLSETRLYVYTFVTDFGEESEPCPASNEVEWSPGQTVTLSGFQAAPAGRNITKQRIYRSQSSTSGTQFYFIAERDVSAANFIDNLPSTAIQEPLPSLDYNAPPDGLRGLIALPNGMMAAFMGKDLYFCEPWQPHAWPEMYVLTMDYDIVGLGAYGTTVVVMTKGNPYIVSGTAPENMQSEKLEFNLPCINAKGIQDLGYAIAYPSNDGLVLASSGGVRVATEELFTREAWQRLSPATIISGQHDGRYLAAYRFADSSSQEYRGSIILDMAGREGFVSRTGVYPTAFYYDITESRLYYIIGPDVYEWDALGEANEIQAWRSKPFILPKPLNMGAILIEAEVQLTDDELAALEEQAEKIRQENEAIFNAGILDGALNAAAINVYPVNGDKLKPVPSVSQTCSVNVYADKKLVASISRVNRMDRLPAGFKAQQWEVEVTGDMTVTQVLIAGTGAELAQA
ncbi:hypothetical protein [Pseudomonas phage Itty13]|uniref:Virion structural protein n=1 Tax=Pseudomonas phage Itty13 TaxID=2805750 RepID=A0A889IQX5_9CAUD|nr:hypothetical protein PQC19_gp09 [Pseudomonas phage Itty13]QRE00585.1 hypothetical protein [Pseudomonas phage Itty13]